MKAIKQFLGIGWWRVIYPDGTWTYPQEYENAVNLVELYGGTIEEAESRFGRRKK